MITICRISTHKQRAQALGVRMQAYYPVNHSSAFTVHNVKTRKACMHQAEGSLGLEGTALRGARAGGGGRE